MSKNFDFLMIERDTAFLFETANFAEKNYVQGDFEGTLTKTRKIAESITKLILEKEYINLPNRTTFNDALRELKKIVKENDVIDAFYAIKGIGNSAAHEINSADATKENAIKALHQVFTILVWFIHKYVDPDIKTAYLEFLEPEAEKLYQTAERKLIYVQTVNNESGMFQAYEGTQKIGEATAPDDDFEVDWSPNSEFLRTVGAKRINQYMKTAGLKFVLEWVELAWKKSTKSWFHDHDVHEVLKRSGVKKPKHLDGSEWFKTDLETAKNAIKAVKEGHSALQTISEKAPSYEIILRPEQKSAVEQTKRNFKKNKKMLWNAKMRFGKTLTSLQLIKEEKYSKVLIMTHRPVVSDSWFEDFGKMKMSEENYRFGSETRGERLENLKLGDTPFIYFVSIQKLRYDGGKANLTEFSDVDWDLIVIDEAHEGTQTELADNVLKSLEKPETKILALSGTPFNIQDQYDESSVYTWDYTMEQRAKTAWEYEHPTERNPYETLPKVNMFTFEMKHKERFTDESKAFNFREFFRVDENGELVHKTDVNAFLDNITNQDSNTDYPFSTEQYRNELRHTLWLMPGVKEANAFEKLLSAHQIFGQEYKIINVVKDDKFDNNEVATAGDLNKVRQAIGEPSETKTITLTVRKLTTGVNIPEWTAVLFLSNTNSAMNYLQAAFRAQTPFSHEKLGMKKNCYIFDFAPDRALSVMAESAQVNSGVGKKNTQEQKDMLTRLLNFMPILGQTENGMKSFNVDKMLTQLKKVYAEKAVRSGFEDDSLYNDNLLTLTEGDTELFKDLNKIVGKTTKVKESQIVISNNGLTDEEYDRGQKAGKRKKKQQTPEEKEILEKIKKAKDQRKTMISILRGVSIRIPMMIYGMKLDLAQDISIQDFVKQVDNESWKEFMPKGFTKLMFKQIVQYYDAEVFIEAGRIIRQRAKSYDQLDFVERAEKIAELFGTFKNPDKETVLTPWRVVNLQLTKTIGGLNFYDDNFVSTTDGAVSSLHWVEQADSQQIYTEATKILEINTKTGLYPLHAAMSLYYKKLEENNDSKFEADEVYKKILKENIFAIAKTPMAKTITERTLSGYKDFEMNVQYIDGFVDTIKESPQKGKEKVEEVFKNVKFDVVIGNPPYQEESIGDSTQAPPIYHKFMDTAYEIANKAVLITPGRFLFNAGATPESWNNKMLNDEHFKIVHFENASYNIFPNTNFGSVAVTYWDKNKKFEPIGIMTNFYELNSIIKKVERKTINTLDSIISGRGVYKLTNIAHIEHPEIEILQSKGHKNDVGTGVFSKLQNIIFFKDKPNDGKEYSKVIGLMNRNRENFWVDTRYITHTPDYGKFKVILPKANGTGLLEDRASAMIGKPLAIPPLVAFTETFISIGTFDTEAESENVLKYVKSKFARAMLGVLKVTQDNPRDKWKYVPLQNFAPDSDIDWTKSLPEIDQQLYAKYKLDEKEILFIEEKVKAMD